MVVTTGEVIAQEFENRIYPVGSPVTYSAYSVGHIVDGEMDEQFVMKQGILAGYDDSFGGIPHVIIEPEGDSNSPFPKCIPLRCLEQEVELVLVDPTVEKMTHAPSKADLAQGPERHLAQRLMAYVSGDSALTV